MGLWRYLVLGTMKDLEQIKAEVQKGTGFNYIMKECYDYKKEKCPDNSDKEGGLDWPC